MRLRTLNIVLLLLLALALVACGGSATTETAPEGPVTGDATSGEALFQQVTIGAGSAPGCITCHSLEADVDLVGPSMAGVGARAGERVEGLSAEDYLHQSIVEPNAHVVDGYAEGVMYQNYDQDLSEQQIADLVAYLLTLD